MQRSLRLRPHLHPHLRPHLRPHLWRRDRDRYRDRCQWLCRALCRVSQWVKWRWGLRRPPRFGPLGCRLRILWLHTHTPARIPQESVSLNKGGACLPMVHASHYGIGIVCGKRMRNRRIGCVDARHASVFGTTSPTFPAVSAILIFVCVRDRGLDQSHWCCNVRSHRGPRQQSTPA